jgi:phage tail sheath gpL-like
MLFPLNGDGVGTIPVTVYPVEPDALADVWTGGITVTGAEQNADEVYKYVTNNFESDEFVIPAGSTDQEAATILYTALSAAASSSKILMAPNGPPPVTPDFPFVTIWKGESAGDINLSIEGTANGLTFAITDAVGPGVNPDGDVTTALAQMGDVWESIIVNCFSRVLDDGNLDLIQTFGETRWGPLVRKPLTSWTGDNRVAVGDQVTSSDSRKDDRIQGTIPDPGSNELPVKIAARAIARIAVIADDNPPQDYRGAQATGLVPGADGVQWTYVERDLAVTSGQSTIKKVDTVVALEDTVTYYHPSGDPLPAYRYLVDIVKLQTILFSLDGIFSAQEWVGSPLIPDNQPTTNKTAKKPKDAVAAISKMVDELGLAAIISDPAFAKTTISAEIDGTNPNRLNVEFSVLLSGNINIIDITANFGFHFGTAPLV